jgi:LPS sulfotransferase NodH
MPTTPFIILANPRSGSTFVRDMLTSHPQAKVYGELFLPAPARERPLWEPNDLEFARVFVDRRLSSGTRLARPYWTTRYIEHVFDQPEARAVGLKLMYQQARHWPEAMLYVTARRVRVVHLLRRNLLDIVLSEKVREQAGTWHVTSDGRPMLVGDKRSAGGSKIRLDPDELLRALNHLARKQRVFAAWLKATRTPSLEVDYERLVAERELFAEILEFIGLDPEDWRVLKTGLEKMNKKTHAELIENIGEVDARLSGTEFGALVRR